MWRSNLKCVSKRKLPLGKMHFNIIKEVCICIVEENRETIITIITIKRINKKKVEKKQTILIGREK